MNRFTDEFELPQLEMGYSNQSRAIQVELSRALFVAVPGENPVHYRPHIMTFNEHSRNNLTSVINNGVNINSAALRKVARDIIRPSKQSQGELVIEGGWNEQRFAFFFEFTIKTPNLELKEIITGYTDNLGFSEMNGRSSWDPNMQFYVNNHMRVSETVREGAYGPVTNLRATDVNQILRPVGVSRGNSFSRAQIDQNAVSIRPKDTIDAAQRSKCPGGAAGILDVRYDLAGEKSSLGVASNRKNETSSSYLSTILQGYSNAHNSNDGVGGDLWLLGTAANYAAEAELSSSVLFNHLAETTSYGRAGCFTYSELVRAHPELNYNTAPPVMPNRGALTSHNNYSNQWGAANLHTQVAHALSHTVPAALSQCLLASVAFTATNRTFDGSIDVSCQSVVAIFETPEDEVFAKRFMSALIYDVFPEIFPDGSDWEIIVSTSLFGLCTMDISFNGQPYEKFTAPNYADGLTSSNIGASVEQLDNMGEQTSGMLESVFSNSTDPGLVTRRDHF